ncbi:MFS transporter [Roseomonas sp. OT10]|uniref:MFS transporter n=1 Tax=Roseomonas cutis TaxID=2897332 RepID=UPI001E533A1B|nr:MFS transporter [Roseomonas sp. OT10]UFN51148.1 MFS transporter [Roseomonas sp. OT10]
MPRQSPPASLASTLPVVAALLAGFGLLQMGNTLQGTLLAVRGGMEGFPTTVIGLIGGGFFAGMMAGSLVAGRMIRAVGQTRSFAALASLASMVPLIHLLWRDPAAWVIARALTGFCFAGLFMAVESWLNGVAANEVRGRILSVYGMTGLAAGVVGQLLLPVADPGGYTLFCLVSILLTAAVVPVALSQAQAPAVPPAETHANLFRLYAQSPFGLVSALLCGASTGAFFSLGPVFAQGSGLSSSGVAVFMAAGATGAALMTWPLGHLSDRVDRRTLVVAIALVAAGVLSAMVLLTPGGVDSWVLYALVFVFGGVVVPTYSVVLAHVNDMVRPEEFVSASAGMLMVQGAGAALGPVAAGAAMSAVGPRSLVWMVVAAQLMIVAWGVWRRVQGPAPATKGDFAVQPPLPVGTELIAAHQDSRRQERLAPAASA